ncbi:hypothetical protein ACFWNN_32740 [Lentzea sp. NPDC058450]|uniref:hypothetical protein n=1 Tax=Lentzea sp. NPDC058450 TaxID=3346505 RepID=UPI003668E990
MKRLFLALALIAAFTPVPAFAAGCDGVTVVVDYRGLGGGVQQGCAAGSPSSGIAALTAAGFGYTYAQRQQGFVCRINGRPGTDTDKCVTTSPATAYWSYWHAPAGGAWTYSNQGAATYVPARGTVQGWAFGAGEQPGIAPPAAPAPPPPVQQPPAQQPPAQQPPAQQPPAATTTTAPPTTSAPSSTAPPSSAASSAAAESSTSVAVETVRPVEEKALEQKSGLGWLWTLLGVLAIAALAIAGLLVARRRRLAEEE